MFFFKTFSLWLLFQWAIYKFSSSTPFMIVMILFYKPSLQIAAPISIVYVDVCEWWVDAR